MPTRLTGNAKRKQTRQTQTPRFEVGSGNIFADIGVAEPEAVLAKARIASRIAATIRSLKLTQTQASKRLGIDQPRVSAILRGRLSLFSLDTLIGYAAKLGNDIEIHIRPASRGRIRVPKVMAACAAYGGIFYESASTGTRGMSTRINESTLLHEAWMASELSEDRREVYEV